MERDEIVDLIAGITSQLKITTSEEKTRVSNLQKSLASILLSKGSISEQSRSRFEKRLKGTKGDDRDSIRKIIDKVGAPKKEVEDVQVEFRNSRLLIENLAENKSKSIDDIGLQLNGARKLKTEGPFPVIEGGSFYVDIFPFLTQLHSVYIEGQSLPALLFKMSIFKLPLKEPEIKTLGGTKAIFGDLDLKLLAGSPKVIKTKKTILDSPQKQIQVRDKKPTVKLPEIMDNPKVQLLDPDLLAGLLERTKLYQVAGNTVWVRANLLSPTAPDDHYCALRISKGSVFLSSLPISEVSRKITVSKTTSIVVNLNLTYKENEDIPNHMFGKDAKNIQLKLPSTFNFTIKNTKATISAISDMECNVYGENYSLKYVPGQIPSTSDFTPIVLIPFKNNKSEFAVKSSQAELIDISGKAHISKSYWGLISQQIDIEKPLEADGVGAVMFDCQKGLAINIKNAEVGLLPQKPSILCTSNGLVIIDEECTALKTSQTLNLWKEESKPFGTSMEFQFHKINYPLMYGSTAKEGEETLYAGARFRLDIDRPIKVDGTPIKVESSNILAMFFGKNEERELNAVDYSALIGSSTNQTEPFQPISFALKNALLTTTPVIMTSISGFYDEKFNTMYEGNITTYYGLLNYLPTFPDPYASNFVIRRGYNIQDGKGIGLENIRIPLINTTTWKKGENVATGFKFPNQQSTQEKTVSVITMKLSNTASNEKLESQLNWVETREDRSEKLPEQIKIRTIATTNSQVKGYAPEIIKAGQSVENSKLFSLLDVSSNANQLGLS